MKREMEMWTGRDWVPVDVVRERLMYDGRREVLVRLPGGELCYVYQC